MRTGEISKVLSKEWQGMPKGEKQYYQDKAKKYASPPPLFVV